MIAQIETSVRLSSSKLDRVSFLNFANPNFRSEYRSLPRVRLLRDWGTYFKGDVLVVYQQLNNGANDTSMYRGVLEGEVLPEGELGGRSWPAEIAEPFLSARAAVSAAREVAKDEALSSSRFVKSRGTYVGTISDKDGPVSPHEPADCHDWRGTDRELLEVVTDVLANYPVVDTVCVTGGFDGSYDGDSLKDFLTGEADYVPWSSSWSVDVWTRKDGWLVRGRSFPISPRILVDETTLLQGRIDMAYLWLSSARRSNGEKASWLVQFTDWPAEHKVAVADVLEGNYSEVSESALATVDGGES